MKNLITLTIFLSGLPAFAIAFAFAGNDAWHGYEQHGTDSNGKPCAVLNVHYTRQYYSWVPQTYPAFFSVRGVTGPEISFDRNGQPYYDFKRQVIWHPLVEDALPRAILLGGMKISAHSSEERKRTKLVAGGWLTRGSVYYNGKFLQYDIAYSASGYVQSLQVVGAPGLRCDLRQSGFESYRDRERGRPYWRSPKTWFSWFRLGS